MTQYAIYCIGCISIDLNAIRISILRIHSKLLISIYQLIHCSRAFVSYKLRYLLNLMRKMHLPEYFKSVFIRNGYEICYVLNTLYGIWAVVLQLKIVCRLFARAVCQQSNRQVKVLVSTMFKFMGIMSTFCCISHFIYNSNHS